jgi:hypothetical protein
MRYARVENNQIVEYRDFADGEIPAHKAQLWRVVEDIIPSYNPFYQVIFGPEVVIEEYKVRYVYTIEDKDPVELKYLVKAEAQNRILSKYPLWKQNNLLISKVELVAKASLTQEEQAALDDINSQLQEIKEIRDFSDVLEAMTPIPEDYRDNKYWQVV